MEVQRYLKTGKEFVRGREVMQRNTDTVRKHYQKRSVVAKQVDDIWTADLVDMSPYSRSNSGNK